MVIVYPYYQPSIYLRSAQSFTRLASERGCYPPYIRMASACLDDYKAALAFRRRLRRLQVRSVCRVRFARWLRMRYLSLPQQGKQPDVR